VVTSINASNSDADYGHSLSRTTAILQEGRGKPRLLPG
jgi:hypothetical protein